MTGLIRFLVAFNAVAAVADLILFIIWLRLPGCRDQRIAVRNAAVRVVTLGRRS